MAALLNDEEKSQKENFEHYYLGGKKRLKYIVLTKEKRSNFKRYLKILSGEGSLSQKMRSITAEELFDMSEYAQDEKIDFFVSHCWMDSARIKFEYLCRLSDQFHKQHGRYPKLWLDVFCINQNKREVQLNVKLLSVFLMACERMLVLKSDRYLSRLWCLTELYTRHIMRDVNVETPDSGIDIIRLDDGEAQLDISSATCSSIQDKELLEAKLNSFPGERETVAKVIKHALICARRLKLN